MASSTISPLAARMKAAARAMASLRRALPALIALLLAAATLGLFALSNTKERSETHDETIADTLLARESIRFQLAREAEALQKIAGDIGEGALGPQALEPRLRLFLRRAGQVQGVALVDATLARAAHVQREGSRGDAIAQVPMALADEAMESARAASRPSFTNAFQADWGASVALFVPVPGSMPPRYLAGVYSLDRLLEEMIPWNLAQDYAFTISDVAGTVRARRAAVGPGRGVYTHQEPLELPGTTLRLATDSVKGAPGWIANALRAGIAALAALLLWSLVALWRDHQHRLAAEQRAQEEAAFRRAMGDSAVIGLAAHDRDGRVTYVNPAFRDMVGYREDELVGRDPPAPYWTSEAHDEYRRRLDDVLEGRAPKSAHETRLMRKNGRLFPAAIYDAPLLGADGRPVGWVSSIVDLTEQKQAAERERMHEERLQTAARLTTMGEMASSLAHELNQPLGAIASYLAGSLNLLERGEAPRGELAAVLAKASAQTQRAGLVIQRVHEFVRKQEPRRESVDLAAMLDDCRPLVDLQARRASVEVQSVVQPNLPPVRGDPVMLQQVILNLTRNAIDAMIDAPRERRRLAMEVSRDGEGERLSVRDFGSGIAEADSENIFAPFFTTKPEGMGMGLSICRTIVQAHGGRLWFERMDQGVAFHLWLPVAP